MVASGVQDKRLDSDNQLEVAYALTDLQVAAIRATDPDIAQRLEKLRAQVWSNTPSDNVTRAKVFNEALAGLEDKQKIRELCGSYAKMGELYEVAGLTARDNLYKDLQNAGKPIPGGVEEFVAKQSSADMAVAKLGVPVFEPILTMHPTNVQGLATMQALRKVSLAIRDDRSKLAEAIAGYQGASILNKVGEKEDNLTVRDETNTILHYLGNLYDDTPGIFKQYDTALSKKGAYDPITLKLDARIGSWGSAGDKDGNDNVTGEKTLEAIVRHTHGIVSRYIEDIREINNPGLDGWKQTFLGDNWKEILTAADWKTKLEQLDDKSGGALGNLNTLLKRAVALSDATDRMRDPKRRAGENSKELNDEFNDLSKALVLARKDLDATKFESDLKTLHNNSKDGTPEEKIAKNKLLEMVRKVRWFGFNFAKIEYRETAEEYQKAVEAIIPDYNKMTAQERVGILQSYLQGDIPQTVVEEANKIIVKGASESLKSSRTNNDNTAIAYHSLKRMELARDYPDVIKDSVLAECGTITRENPPPDAAEVRAQGVANMLESLFLQRIVKDAEGKYAKIGIVPLFEDPSTMENIGGIMQDIYKNPAYAAYMQELTTHLHEVEIKKADYLQEPLQEKFDGKPTQQVQIAHSDNRRRAGSLGGTALIHEAHRIVRQVNDEAGIKTQFFEGGSLSDPFRNGIRSITAQVNAFGMHDYAKFTFQGRDLFNYFNHPGSNERMFTRHFVSPAEHFHKTSAGWQMIRNSNGNGNGKVDRTPNSIVEEIAVDVLKRTLDDYRNEDFIQTGMGTAAAMIGEGYNRESKDANWGSRAAVRGGMDTGKPISTHVGKVWTVDLENGVRTIPFSMIWQQNGINPSLIGGVKLRMHIYDEVLKRVNGYRNNPAGYFQGKTQDEINGFKEMFEADIVHDRGILPKHIHYMYDKSPTFRDAMDKEEFAVARTDMNAVTTDLAPKFSDRTGDDAEQKKIKQDGRTYVQRLKATYRIVSEIAYEALTGQARAKMGDEPEERNGKKLSAVERYRAGNEKTAPYQRYKNDPDGEDKIQAGAKIALNGLGKDINLQDNYMSFILHAKAQLGEKNKFDDDPGLLPTLLAGGQAAMYTRFLSADDPATAVYREAVKKQAVAAAGRN